MIESPIPLEDTVVKYRWLASFLQILNQNLSHHRFKEIWKYRLRLQRNVAKRRCKKSMFILSETINALFVFQTWKAPRLAHIRMADADKDMAASQVQLTLQVPESAHVYLDVQFFLIFC